MIARPSGVGRAHRVRHQRARRGSCERASHTSTSRGAGRLLAERATKAARNRFESALATLPDVPPDDGDELPAGYRKPAPVFFEQLVLDLLLALGYGASEEDLERVGKTSDGGIDGVITLDKLGFERVYVQAKRWQGSVGRPEIQAFFGALAGRRARKGVFITSSNFTREAREFGNQVSERIVLIDGGRLTSLMIDYGVGVAHYKTIRLPRVDEDYFDSD